METTQTKRLPGNLAALAQQLEQIRQEQIAKNRTVLRTLAIEQQRHIEILTSAIVGKIFDDVIRQWEVSIAEGNETQISKIIELIWGARPAAISHAQTSEENRPGPMWVDSSQARDGV